MKRTAKPKLHADGYTEYPKGTTRPHCDMCGPFASRFLRRLPSGEWRCEGCDKEC